MRRFAVLSAVALLGACGDSGPSNDVPADVEIVEPDAASKFGESGPQRAQREAADRAAGVGSYWVSGDVATEPSDHEMGVLGAIVLPHPARTVTILEIPTCAFRRRRAAAPCPAGSVRETPCRGRAAGTAA